MESLVNVWWDPTTCRVNITFIDRDGDKIIAKAKLGDSLLDVAKDNDVDLEGMIIAAAFFVFYPSEGLYTSVPLVVSCRKLLVWALWIILIVLNKSLHCASGSTPFHHAVTLILSQWLLDTKIWSCSLSYISLAMNADWQKWHQIRNFHSVCKVFDFSTFRCLWTNSFLLDMPYCVWWEGAGKIGLGRSIRWGAGYAGSRVWAHWHVSVTVYIFVHLRL